MAQNLSLDRHLTTAASSPADGADAERETEYIPSHLAERRQSGLNVKFLAAGGALIALIIALMTYGLFTASSYYLTVDEVNEHYASAIATGDEAALRQRIRVNGEVVAGSEDWNAREVTLRFTISDESGEQLPIVFYGPRPDNFQRAASAIVEGKLLPDGSFQADTLLLKCPSRYEEEPEEIFVKSTR